MDVLTPKKLPSSAHQKLKCSECENPLSRFPVYTNIALGTYICGRCPTPTDQTIYMRNLAYEELACFTKFNCSHKQYGCLQLLFPREVENHEKYCRYRQYECPLGKGVCSWQGFYEQHLDHFTQNHKDCIVNERQIDFNNSCKTNDFLTFGDEYFIVTTEVDSILKKFTCIGCCIRWTSIAENFHYTLEFSGLNMRCSFRTVEKLSDLYEITEGEIKQTLRNPDVIQLRIKIKDLNEGENENTAEVIRDNIKIAYECPSCLENLLPPIYQCTTGHNICETCKRRVLKCPTCKARIEQTRNFALEELTLSRPMSCKNMTCTFSGKGSVVQQHQKWCVHGIFPCPFFDDAAPCRTSLPLGDMLNHVTSEHKDFLLEFNSADGYYRPTFKNTFVLKHGSRLFRLLFSSSDGRVCWSLQLIGNGEDCKQFKFEVDLSGNKGENGICVQGPCTSILSKNKCFMEGKKFLYVDHKQVQMLLKNNGSYKVRILSK